MTFPDGDFRFAESGKQSMTSVAKQIGNAVPPTLAACIADAVATQLESASRESPELRRRLGQQVQGKVPRQVA